MSKFKKGYVQVYTGNGKGKTTAAIGQAVRAAGFGAKTYIAQFMKEYPYNEIAPLNLLNEWIRVEQFGKDDFVYRREDPNDEEKDKILLGLKISTKMMLSGGYDVVILDEICVCVYFKLITTQDILDFITLKPEGVELILTGRYCPPEVIEVADLVTEMKEVKHYYMHGVLSRRGIES